MGEGEEVVIEPALVAAIASLLGNIKWRVRPSDTTSARQQDIVVTNPEGQTFVIELKFGDEPAHFASLAQVERLARLVGQQSGEEVTPVLVTGQEVNPSILNMAEKVGVRLVEASGTTEQIAAAVADNLGRPSPLPE